MPSSLPRVVRLTRPGTAATADILPEYGAACVSATLVRDGVAREVVWAPTELDDVFVDLMVTDGRVRTQLVDPAGGAIGLEFDPVFTACVVCTPPHRQALCIEPWTAVPDAPPFLPARGWRILQAGESLSTGLTITAE